MSLGQKTVPEDTTIIDRRNGKEVTYKGGDVVETSIWRLFEIYVMDFIASLLPDAKVETQREFVDKNNRIHARVDGYIETDKGKRRILIEIKHYASSKVGKPAVDKILRDQRIIKPDDYWIVISPETKFSSAAAKTLFDKNIKIVRVVKGWENRIIELVGAAEKPGDEKIEPPTGLEVEWVFES